MTEDRDCLMAHVPDSRAQLRSLRTEAGPINLRCQEATPCTQRTGSICLSELWGPRQPNLFWEIWAVPEDCQKRRDPSFGLRSPKHPKSCLFDPSMRKNKLVTHKIKA